MKHIVSAAVALLIAATPALAQTTSSTANGSGTATSNMTSDVTNENTNQNANQVYIDQRAPGSTKGQTTIKNTGDYTVRSAPPVQAPSMGSGHPCAIAGSVGISIIGGGVSGGGMKVDEACLLAQMGQGEAALIMIAQRDAAACKALRQTGRISGQSLCDGSERRAAADQRKQAERTAAASPTPARSPITCVSGGTNAQGRPVIRAQYDAKRTTAEQAAAYCRNNR